MGDYTVYKHINKTNGKVYVGITKRKPEDRWKNGNGYSTQYFSRAIEKYGWDGFEHIVVCENLSRVDACAMERILIKAYNSANPEFGYNQTLGGDGGGMLGKHQSDVAKRKISIARRRDGFSEEHKKHISESKQGIKHHMAKPVYQYTRDGKFVRGWNYMNEAAKTLGLSKGNISNACLGRVKTCGGYIWSYEYEGESI